MVEVSGKGSFDEHHERAGYALIGVGLLVFLLASLAAVGVVTKIALSPDTNPMIFVYIAALGVATAGFGTWTLVGVQRYRGVAMKGPGGTSLEID